MLLIIYNEMMSTFHFFTGSTGIGGFTFGATSSAAPSTGSSGQSTSGFSFGAKPAFGTQATTSASAGGTGFSFGQTIQPTSQAAAATSTGATGQISFGLPTPQPTAATLPSLGSFGATSGLKSGTTGFSFGSQPAGLIMLEFIMEMYFLILHLIVLWRKGFARSFNIEVLKTGEVFRSLSIFIKL